MARIPDWAWRPNLEHNQEEDFGRKCEYISFCPYRYKDGTICGKIGCAGVWWQDVTRSHDDVVYKVAVVRHAHYLVDSYPQSRNTSHIIPGTLRLAEPNETEWRLVLKQNLKIPRHIIEDFRDANDYRDIP